MATILQIKRSSGTTSPAELAQGELAYTYGSGSQGNNGDRLFIGTGTETNGVAANIDVIGGKYFTDLTDHVHGTLTASSAIIVDSNKAIDDLYIGNSTSTGGSIKFNEGTNNGSNYVALKAPNSIDSNITLTLPSSYSAGQFLTVDGSGNLSFTDVDTTLTFVDDSSTTINIPSSQSVKISGGTGLTSTASGSTITLDLDNTAVTPNTYGSSTAIPVITVDQQGRITSASTQNISTTLTIADDSSTTVDISLGSDTLKIAGGTGITSSISGDTISISTSSIPNASLQNSSVTIGSTSISLGATSTTLAGITQLDIDNVRIDGNTISSTDTDGNITLTPNGSGDINLSADTVKIGDSNTNATITTNGTGNLVLSTNEGTNSGTITLHQGVDGNIFLTPNGQGVVKVPSGYIDRTQLDANSLVTKAYVDAIQQGLHVHESVKVATTSQLTNLIGSSTVTYNNGTDGVGATLTLGAAITQIDGYNLINGDRILVKDELNYAHNGIYIRTNSTLLTRATDFDSAVEVASGDFLFVQEGTVNGNNGFVQTEVCNTLGTDDILFTQFSGAGQIIAGDGLLKTGNELDVVVDNTTIEIATDELRVKNAGITAAKLATDAVETSKIADAAVTNAKLANSVIYFTDESSTQGSVSLGGNIEFLAGEGIDTTVIGNTVRISGELATSSNAGVAYFPTANFTVTSGSVAITKIDGGTF